MLGMMMAASIDTSTLTAGNTIDRDIVLANDVTVKDFNTFLSSTWEVFGTEVITPISYDRLARRLRGLPEIDYPLFDESNEFNFTYEDDFVEHIIEFAEDYDIDATKMPTIHEIEANHPGLRWEEYAYNSKNWCAVIYSMTDYEEFNDWLIHEPKSMLDLSSDDYKGFIKRFLDARDYFNAVTQGTVDSSVPDFHSFHAQYVTPSTVPSTMYLFYEKAITFLNDRGITSLDDVAV